MSVECIHGLDDRMCDLCFPKPVPEMTSASSAAGVGARLRTATATRVRPTVRSAPRRTATTVDEAGGALQGRRAAHLPPHPGGEPGRHPESRRVALRPARGHLAEVVRQARRKTRSSPGEWLPTTCRSSSPRTPGSGRRSGLRRLTRGSHRISAASFRRTSCCSSAPSPRRRAWKLSSPIAMPPSRLPGSPQTRRRASGCCGACTATRMPSRDAEFLVKGTFPFELVSLIGVAHAKSRDVVKAILSTSGYSTKVSVYPPWFQRPEE